MENSSTRFMQSCEYIVYKEEEDCFETFKRFESWEGLHYLSQSSY